VPLLTKLTKRCPHADCRHLLVQPDIKSTRFKIKQAASAYIPTIEVGRRRRRLEAGAFDGTPEDIERRRRDRRRARRDEVDEDMTKPLHPGEIVRAL
jgi:dynactin-4